MTANRPRVLVGVDLELKVLRLLEETTEAEVASHLGVTVPDVREIVASAIERTATYYGIDTAAARVAVMERSHPITGFPPSDPPMKSV